jgi:hypothetical protein
MSIVSRHYFGTLNVYHKITQCKYFETQLYLDDLRQPKETLILLEWPIITFDCSIEQSFQEVTDSTACLISAPSRKSLIFPKSLKPSDSANFK